MPKFIEASSMLRELPLMMSSVVTCRMPRYEEAISPFESHFVHNTDDYRLTRAEASAAYEEMRRAILG